jgi:O-antigen ligase
MAVTTTHPQQLNASNNAFHDVGYGLLVLYVFLLFSRIPESFPSLHLGLLMMLALLAITVVSMSFQRAIFNRIGLPLLGFCAWLALSIPFSVWRGGSMSSFVDWAKAFGVFIIVAGLVTTVRQCRRIIYAAAAGILWVALAGTLFGSVGLSRISLSIGRYGDANDFAQIMLVGLAFWCLIASDPKRNAVGKLVAVGCIGLQLIALAKTGSRGGLIGFALTALILFMQSSSLARLKLIVVLCAATVIGIGFLPHTLLMRYRSIYSEDITVQSDQEYKEQEAALGSRLGRTYLLKTSLMLTLRHPITGVGLGMFMVAENEKARDAGRANGSWHETHNMYTQVSSEAGIPALILFIMAMTRALRDCSAIRKGRHPASEIAPTPEQRSMAFWLYIALWGYLTTGFFLSIAFTPELQFALGLLAAFGRSVHLENAQATGAQPVFALPVPRKPAIARAQPVVVSGIHQTGY